MRDIRFRAWDVINKQMYSIAFPTWNGAIEGKLELTSGLVEIIEEDGDNKPILMQYTGLKDKNGKEIYEGDIVRYYECAIPQTEEVEFMHGCFYPVGQSVWIDNGKTHDMEIIGNIYENPELLKEI